MITNLTHYTNSAKSVHNILNHGFAWVRNDREVINYLLSNVDFSKREPQSFGQICFTENLHETNRNHTKFFGSFGIEVTWNWARKNNIQPVLYIPKEGPLLEAFKFLFEQAYRKAKAEEKYPDDTFRQMWEHSAVMAKFLGASLYANLLMIYEYMEPVRYSNEREWRITNPLPNLDLSKSLDRILSEVSPPRGWAKFHNVLKIEPNDIEKIYCEKSNQEKLLDCMPTKFKDVLIDIY